MSQGKVKKELKIAISNLTIEKSGNLTSLTLKYMAIQKGVVGFKQVKKTDNNPRPFQLFPYLFLRVSVCQS